MHGARHYVLFCSCDDDAVISLLVAPWAPCACPARQQLIEVGNSPLESTDVLRPLDNSDMYVVKVRSGASACSTTGESEVRVKKYLESSDRCAAAERVSGGHFDESCSCLSRRSFVTRSSWAGEKSGGRHRSRDGDRPACPLATVHMT